ncbi:MAG TPA: cytochrome c [Blastocatellia bacterium]|nr:cytochrome c [Blastocatellia bacterium]
MNRLKLLIFFATALAVACGTAKNELAVKDVTATRALYTDQKCVTCHGEKGDGGIGPSFKVGAAMTRSVEDLAARIGAGSGQMPAFKEKLSQEEIHELAKYVYKEIQGR